jgi:hypothetical protein
MTLRWLVRSTCLSVFTLTSLALVRCGEQDDDLTQGECDDLGGQASSLRQAEEDSAAGVCATDAACVLVYYPLDCATDCGDPVAVARSRVPALEARIASINAEICGAFEAGNCRPPVLEPCAPWHGPPSAVCVDQTCKLILPPR